MECRVSPKRSVDFFYPGYRESQEYSRSPHFLRLCVFGVPIRAPSATEYKQSGCVACVPFYGTA